MKTPYYSVPNLQKIADLQAEVARLNEALELQIHVTGSACACIDERNKLITKLADALGCYKLLWDGHSELIQLSREVVERHD